MDTDVILQTLEAVAERGDPMAVVYRRLFEAYPETERLFIMGPSAKGHMLDEVLNVILDFIGARTYGGQLMRCEVVNHENLGVPPDAFMAFFPIVRDGLREVAGDTWTPEMDRAWAGLLVELQAEFGRVPA
ncbi:MAG TPA: globin [Caulobacteraceae bacterium]|jgi:hemoglobin-like flavoprotein